MALDMLSDVPTDEKTRRLAAQDQLASDILEESRVQLMLKFRFLDRALWRMELKPFRGGARYPLASNGDMVVFDPARVISRFQESNEEVIRDYLHMVMHCIFRQPFDEGHENREAWELTCDILVENAVLEICGNRFESDDDALRQQALHEIRLAAGNLLPGRVYKLVDNLMRTAPGQHYRGIGAGVINQWRDLFERDDHGAWPALNKNTDLTSEQGAESSQGLSRDETNPDVELDRITSQNASDYETDNRPQSQPNPGEDDISSGVSDESDDASSSTPDGVDDGLMEQSSEVNDETEQGEQSAAPLSDRTLESDWEEIAKELELDLETFSREWGNDAGELLAHLSLVNRKRYSYDDFLRRFMAPREAIQLNMDEFDYVYYTYGMDAYGNMPLVEPLEYKEGKRVEDFVIVIDTSESVKGELVKRFVEHTFGILKDTQSFARDVHIHIIQADSKVQSDMVINDLSDVDKLMEHFAIKGFGGTDFRPAFSYINWLRGEGKLPNLKGVIYFTDGLGQFPEKAPDYEAAFVFMEEEGKKLPPVPPWAIKLVLDERDLDELSG